METQSESGSVVQELLREIESQIQASGATGIVTICSDHFNRTFDVDPKTLVWGYQQEWRDLLGAKLLVALEQPRTCVAVMLRTFRKERVAVRYPDGKTRQLPVKELRGYRLMHAMDQEYYWEGISEGDLFSACNTDAHTGELLTPEPDVTYIGTN
jgi:hypothetical protein